MDATWRTSPDERPETNSNSRTEYFPRSVTWISRRRIGTRASLDTLHALRPARAMAFNGLSLGGFTMGAVDGPTKMDVSLDDIIKQVRAAVGPRSPRLPRDNFASARTLTFESSHPEHAPRARRRPRRRRKPPPRKRRRWRCVFERAIRPRRPGEPLRVRIDRANAHLPNRIRARRDSRVPASDARPSRPDPTRPASRRPRRRLPRNPRRRRRTPSLPRRRRRRSRRPRPSPRTSAAPCWPRSAG